ncbi:MAG: hypothetical protein KAV87_26965 [Desulfobacteraceae bacterium]|nr:hypothetical protein [Desulfobacteraceae bacterium]
MKENVWSEMVVSLDEDERLVWPHMYFQNRQMYDSVSGVAYIVKDRNHPEAGLDWIWANHVEKLLEQGNIQILAKQFVVRLRLPWNELRYEWLISQEELCAHRKDFEIIDVFLRVRIRENDMETVLIDPLEFETNRDTYEILEIRYLVAWKFTPKTEQMLSIDPNSVTTWMQQ